MRTGGNVDLVGFQIVQRLGHIAKRLILGVLKDIVLQHGAGIAGHLQALVLGLPGQDVGCVGTCAASGRMEAGRNWCL